MFDVGFNGRIETKIKRIDRAGTPACAFEVSKPYRYLDESGTERDGTMRIKVVVYRPDLIEACKSTLKKGKVMFLMGNLVADPTTGGPQAWIDKAGKPRSKYGIELHWLDEEMIPF